MGARPGSNNRGGPRTAAGKARALANLNPQAGVKHGLYCQARAPRCDTCKLAGECSGAKPGGTCEPEAVRQQIVADVMALPFIREEERPEAEEYARLALRWYMPWLWPAVYSLRTPRGLLRLMHRLGLTPAGQAERWRQTFRR